MATVEGGVVLDGEKEGRDPDDVGGGRIRRLIEESGRRTAYREAGLGRKGHGGGVPHQVERQTSAAAERPGIRTAEKLAVGLAGPRGKAVQTRCR